MPRALTCSTMVASLPISSPYSPANVSWDHLPNKPLPLKSLSAGLLLEEPKLRQIAKALSWKQFRTKKHNMKPLSSLRIHFEPPADFILTLEKDLNVKLALLDINICHIYSKEIHTELQNSSLFLSLKSTFRASLVAQWLRICLLMQETRVRALVWEDPTCRGATRPVSHNY